MKETIGNIKEPLGITGGLTAPIWLESLNQYVGCLIGIFTLIYVIMKCIDMFYKWLYNWDERKLIKQSIKNELKKEYIDNE